MEGLFHDGRDPQHICKRGRVVSEPRYGQRPCQRVGERSQGRSALAADGLGLVLDALGEPVTLWSREPRRLGGPLLEPVQRNEAKYDRRQSLEQEQPLPAPEPRSATQTEHCAADRTTNNLCDR